MTASVLPRPERLIHIAGGRFVVGTDTSPLPQDGEAPARRVDIRPFAIDPLAVSNDMFAAFVGATGYRTEAECFGWSLVFRLFVEIELARLSPDALSWWCRIEGACWRHPEGPDSTLRGRGDHPVVHVSWHDAMAFAAWVGGRLPSEAEWECAAAGGLAGARFPWGDAEPDDTGYQPCNIWQGDFPTRNSAADGYVGTAPVKSFVPNGSGLHNMVGNVWEWCADPFRIRSISRPAKQRNKAARVEGMRLLKGGSYLCHKSYCYRYRIAARTGAGADSSTGHVGFRLAFDIA